jgi:predicted nucleotidyltransferase
MLTAKPNVELPMEAIGAICRRYHVRELSIFGSVLRDDFRPDSDIDFLVLFEPDATIGLMDLAGLQIEFSELLKRPVDVVPKRGLKPMIRESVLDSAQVIYEAGQTLLE